MRRVVMLACALVLVAGPAYAGGDKVRGDKGQGEVNQEQKEDPPPFQDDGTGDLFWLLGIFG